MDTNQLNLKRAEAAIAAQLGISADKVKIGSGDIENSYISIDKKSNFVITVNDAAATIDRPGLEKKIRHALSRLAPVKAVVLTHDDSEIGGELYKAINEATKGTSFNQHYIESLIFATGKLGPGESIRDYAIDHINTTPYGLDFTIHAPTTQEGGTDNIAKYLDAKIRERLPDIKAELMNRAEKYIRQNLAPLTPEQVEQQSENYRKTLEHMGKNPAEVDKLVAEAKQHILKNSTKCHTPEQVEQEVAKARALMERLKITANMRNHGASVGITIRSPEQEQALEKNGNMTYHLPHNADELRATNPLNSLHAEITKDDPHPQLQKAVSRAFLHAGKNAEEMLNLVAGRHDMKVVLLKEMDRIQKEVANNPAKLAEIKALTQKIETSDLFKLHRVEFGAETSTAPVELSFSKSYKEDKIEARALLEHEQIKTLINKLAELGPKTAAAKPDSNVSILSYITNSLGLTSKPAERSAGM